MSGKDVGYGGVTGVTITGGGSAFTGVATVAFTAGGGSGATATAAMGVHAITVTGAGAYSVAPTGVTFTGGGGSGATAGAITTSGTSPNIAVTAVAVATAGTGFTSQPTLSFTGGTGTAATATCDLKVVSATMGLNGNSYTTAPTVTISAGGGSGATATATVSATPDVVDTTSSDFQFGMYQRQYAPVTKIQDETGQPDAASMQAQFPQYAPNTQIGATGAAGTVSRSGNTVNTVAITNPGVNYKKAPLVSFTGGGGSGATATSTVDLFGHVTAVTVTAAGSSYTSNPTVVFTPVA